MSSSSHQLLRLLVLLLLAIFISQTVYAGGMMTALPVSSSHTEANVAHCHDLQDAHPTSSQIHQTHEKQQSHSSCKDCSHCFACFSMMVQAQLKVFILQTQMLTTLPFVEIYHSLNSAQPQKPPIV